MIFFIFETRENIETVKIINRYYLADPMVIRDRAWYETSGR